MRPDEEIEVLRAGTHCAALLEHSIPAWGLYRRESTNNRLKYRRGKVEIRIVNHGAAAGGGRPGEDETDRVRLMTLNKAKGLEFPHVFLAAWEAGVFPSDYGDADEERRLAYVALTRGMRRVSISYCGFRRGFGAPSLFIDDIPDAHCVKGRFHAADRRRDAARRAMSG